MDKDTILKEIVPHLSVGSRGPALKVPIVSILQAILYRLKTGCQWRELPMKQFFTQKYSCKSVYRNFREWCRDGSWLAVWTALLKKYRSLLDLSSVQLDGSLTIAKRGGIAVGYQGRRKAEATNMLYLVDNSGMPVSCSAAISGEHHDLYQIRTFFQQLCTVLQQAGIELEGLFLNADAGFDSTEFRECCSDQAIIANIPENPRNAQQKDSDQYFDQLLYSRRSAAERAFAWMDSCKALLIRFETLTDTWYCMNLLGMIRSFMLRIVKLQHKFKKL
jgi:transposase